MMLGALPKGMRGRIERLPVGDIRSHFIRIGMVEGAVVACLERLPGGTMVLEFSRQEVALSGDLADTIEIQQL
ncbi:MAG: ferrous iron transport protein A [Bacteroidetes bacterium]|nr:ferrous iron transport protein A [Bacteroidota bacterium]